MFENFFLHEFYFYDANCIATIIVPCVAHLYFLFIPHHFRRLQLFAGSSKSEGCALMAFSFGEGRDEASLLTTFEDSDELQGRRKARAVFRQAPFRGFGGFYVFVIASSKL